MAPDNVFRSSITPADVQAVSPASPITPGRQWSKACGTGRDYRDEIETSSPLNLIARIQTIGMEHYFAIP